MAQIGQEAQHLEKIKMSYLEYSVDEEIAQADSPKEIRLPENAAATHYVEIDPQSATTGTVKIKYCGPKSSSKISIKDPVDQTTELSVDLSSLTEPYALTFLAFVSKYEFTLTSVDSAINVIVSGK